MYGPQLNVLLSFVYYCIYIHNIMRATDTFDFFLYTLYVYYIHYLYTTCELNCSIYVHILRRLIRIDTLIM